MNCDVAVIGAGPAGLSAAGELVSCGLDVVVVDEYYKPGGRLLGQLYEDRRKPKGQQMWNGASVAAALEKRAVDGGARIVLGKSVWAITRGWQLHIAPGPDSLVNAAAVVVATGAAERALPVPGWTLPGVMTIGAAQVFTTVHRVAPGDRVLVVGVDPLSLAITGEMVAAGVNVVGVMLPPPDVLSDDSTTPLAAVNNISRAAAHAPSALLRFAGLGARYFPRLAVGLAKLSMLRPFGVPLYLRMALAEILGDTEVRAARIRSVSRGGRWTGDAEILQVDAVCLSGGLYPLTDLVELAECPLVDIPQLGGRVPLHGPGLETMAEGMFVAGNIVGIEGAAVAIAQGRLAGISAARYLGALGKHDAKSTLDAARHQVDVARLSLPFHFLPSIENGHQMMSSLWLSGETGDIGERAPQLCVNSQPNLVICRCEEVTTDSIQSALENGASTVPGVKKRTRACMGPCQGRICERSITILGQRSGKVGLMAQRSQIPARPVRVGDL